MATEDWKIRAAHRRQTLLDKIPSGWKLDSSWTDAVSPDVKQTVIPVPAKSGILSAKELNITENHDATSLLEALASGKYSSFDVTMAFCKRAAIAHQLVSFSCRSISIRYS